MVMFIFGDRDIESTYFPNDRVLYDLRKKEMSLAEGLNSSDSIGLSLALEEAKVDFDASNIGERDCNIYVLNLEDEQLQFEIENCDSTATVLAVKRP